MSSRLFSFLAVLAVLAASPAARAEIRTVQRSLPGLPGAALKVECYRGSVAVEASTDGQFHIEITVDSGTDDPVRSKRLLKAVLTEIAPAGPAVDVAVRNPSETGWHFDDGEPSRLSIYCHCLVPAACDLTIATRNGGITVGDLAGRIEVRGRNGTLFLRSIRGDIQGEEEGGDVVLSHCTGSARFRAMQGNIRAGVVEGKMEATTTNGDIDVQGALGGAVLSATAGNITLGLPKDPAGATRIETDGGAITVRIDPEVHCSVRATSVWGKVHLRTMVPMAVRSGGDGRKTLVGTLNGGGPLVTLHANGGQVSIQPLNP
jgi:hypothetical protein